MHAELNMQVFRPLRKIQSFVHCLIEFFGVGQPMKVRSMSHSVFVVWAPITASIARLIGHVCGYVAQRIGEARNPGPSCSKFSISVSNPCSLATNLDTYADLPAQIHCVSETSQTAMGQSITGKALKAKGFKIAWGHPVPAQRQSTHGHDTLRGMSTGVAVLSRFPIMEVQDAMPPEWLQTCRIVETLVRVGCITLKIVTIYGFQSSLPQSKEMTNTIMAAALRCSEVFPGMTLICGDFNFKPSEMAIWPEFVRGGFQDATDIGLARWPHLIHGTCRDSTNHDTVLIPKGLLPSLCQFEVLPFYKMDSHSPAVATFQMPDDGFFHYGMVIAGHP